MGPSPGDIIGSLFSLELLSERGFGSRSCPTVLRKTGGLIISFFSGKLLSPSTLPEAEVADVALGWRVLRGTSWAVTGWNLLVGVSKSKTEFFCFNGRVMVPVLFGERMFELLFDSSPLVCNCFKVYIYQMCFVLTREDVFCEGSYII